MPSSAPSLPLASRFSKRSGSRESIQPCSRQMGPKHEVSLLTLCPLGQPKKAIGHESQIELWLTHAHRIRFACGASEIESSPHLSFPSSSIIAERSSPSRGRCAAPYGAPLTAPGRSEEHIPHKREREAWKHRQPADLGNMMTLPGWEHTRPLRGETVTRYCATTRRQSARGKGWMPRRIFARLQLDGELFLLTSPFIEPQGGPISSGPRLIWKPTRWL